MAVSQRTGKPLPKVIVVSVALPSGQQVRRQQYECLEPGCPVAVERTAPEWRCPSHRNFGVDGYPGSGLQ